MKYLVMECHPGYAVVLSADGRFLKVANLRYEVGQTVTRVTEVSMPQRQPVKTRRPGWVTQLGAMAACLVLVAAAALFYGQMPYASVYMTINPQVRIDVNRRDTVLDVEGMNPDGAYLLHGYDPGRKDLDTVMDELVDRAIDIGYLHEGGRITLELDGRESWVNSHSDHLNDHLTEYLTDRVTVTVDVEKIQNQKSSPKPAASDREEAFEDPVAPSAPTAPAGPIVIPVTPDAYEDSGYGDSDYEGSGYGDSEYGDSDYAGSVDSDYDDSDDSDYGDSDYTGSGSAVSDYDDSDYAGSAGSGSAASDYDDPASDYEADSDYSGGSTQSSDYSDYGSPSQGSASQSGSSQGSSSGGSTSSSGTSQPGTGTAKPADPDSDYEAESSYSDAEDDGSDYDDSDYDD